MLFIDKKLSDLKEEDLTFLIKEEVPESRWIDYKRAIHDLSVPEGKKEFLADVCSFANAEGGFILFGISEKNRKPISIDGIEAATIEKSAARMLQVARAGIDPVIMGLAYHEVKLASGGSVLILSIPKSWYGPHIVWTDKRSNFFSRTADHKFEMSVSELRGAFNNSDSLPERIARFRNERLGRVLAEDLPMPLFGKRRLVIHFIPESSFGNVPQPPLELVANFLQSKIAPSSFTNDGYAPRWTLDGFMKYEAGRDALSRGCQSFVTVFKNCSIEAVDAVVIDDTRHQGQLSVGVTERIVKSVRQYMEVLAGLKMEPPIYVFVALLNVKGMVLVDGNPYYPRDYYPFSDANLIFPEVKFDEPNEDAGKKLRPIFDALWNAAGAQNCHLYDKEGKFLG